MPKKTPPMPMKPGQGPMMDPKNMPMAKAAKKKSKKK